MKNLLFSIILLSLTFGAVAQEIPFPKKFEVKLNTLNLLVFEYLEISSEYLIHEESAVGLSVLMNLNRDFTDNEDLFFGRKRSFSISPYFRQYFSKSYASGFFLEAFGMLNGGSEYDYERVIIQEASGNRFSGENIKTFDYTSFGFGLSIGGKWVSKRGFVFEIYSGLGRNLLGTELSSELITRGGIGIGYRF